MVFSQWVAATILVIVIAYLLSSEDGYPTPSALASLAAIAVMAFLMGSILSLVTKESLLDLIVFRKTFPPSQIGFLTAYILGLYSFLGFLGWIFEKK